MVSKIAAASKVCKGFVERRICGRNLRNLVSAEPAAVCAPIIRGTLNFHKEPRFEFKEAGVWMIEVS